MSDPVLHVRTILASAWVVGAIAVAAQESPNRPGNAPGFADTNAAARWVTPAVRAPRVEFQTFDSAGAQTKVSFHIYKPEAYEAEKERRFPVIYWLHGTGGGAAGIAPCSALFDRAIREEKIPPMLIVFPNGMAASMWCDSKDGSVPMETVVVKDLVAHVDATFRTIAGREGRLIEGFSMGGYGAARLGFKYPEVFGAVSILAGGPLDLEFQGPRARGNPTQREHILKAVFGGDLDSFKAQSPLTLAATNAAIIRSKTLVRQAVGDRDFTAELNRAFSDQLKKLDLPHTFTLVPGVEHNAIGLLKGLGEANWEFYRAVFGKAANSAPQESGKLFKVPTRSAQEEKP